MPLKILHESATLLVVDKPAGITVWSEGMEQQESLVDLLLGQFPELELLGEKLRYGIIHRLDKDTSGVLLVAKTKEAFQYFQEQFQKRTIAKQYTCLVKGTLKEKNGTIHTLLGRSPADRRRQKAFLLAEPGSGRREAITEWIVMENFKDFTLLQITPKTGRKHQIRAHMASISHPVAGDKLYGFKNQVVPEGLERQFLHASSLKVQMPDGKEEEFTSPLPEDLKKVLEQLQ